MLVKHFFVFFLALYLGEGQNVLSTFHSNTESFGTNDFHPWTV